MGSIPTLFGDALPVAGSAMATMIIFVAVSSAALAIYRLFFSPLALAGVPGPKIAAITAWYEFYWDCMQQGRYLFKIEQMHQKYGPYLLFPPVFLIAPFYTLLDSTHSLFVSSFMRDGWLVGWLRFNHLHPYELTK